MLTEIYNWFTEGFDTADLKAPRRCSTSWVAKRCYINLGAIRFYGSSAHGFWLEAALAFIATSNVNGCWA
ncbi:MAG: hypothetical protein JO121_23880 [Deltaproteobacteria bacterium]|nr:hypothetical protein [Deltaproteobacteria bacterium]